MPLRQFRRHPERREGSLFAFGFVLAPTQSKLFRRGGSQTRPCRPQTSTTQNTRRAFPRALYRAPIPPRSAMGAHEKMSEVRILIADDSPTVRAGLKLLLQYHPEWIVCGEAEDGQDAVQKATALQPDVILLDISMPALDGLSAAEIIRRDVPNSEILIVTHFESLDLARYAAQTGVRAYITKSRIGTDLEKAIEAASRHQSP